MYDIYHISYSILEIIRKSNKPNDNISINTNSEIYRACRHRPKFLRYTYFPPSTDEGRSPQRCEMEVMSS